jgi:hypothetical protein
MFFAREPKKVSVHGFVKELGMVRVLCGVRVAGTRFGARVRAESIRRAVGVAEARYPGGDVRVVLPIDADGFFVDAGGAEEDVIERYMLESLAG